MNESDNISPRQAKILAAIVKENCETGQPVASGDLVEKYNFNISSPTIRNEMQALEKTGYISQPHTSAGRVPTDKGFRYFVNQLMDRVKLTVKEQDNLKRELVKLQMVHIEMSRRLAKLLSEHSNQASFAIFPEEVSTIGLSNILDNPALPAEDAKEIAQFFDNIDEHAEKMMADYGGKKPQTFIGKEIQLSKKSDYSMIVSGLQLPSGKKGVIGLVGPKSMKYEKNLTLMEYIAKLLGGGAGMVLLIILASTKY
jgi:transcriptional regulator of heat shock response